MSRRGPRGPRLVLSAGMFLLACHRPEEQTLSKFFDAVRSADYLTLAGMSVEGFSGPVDSWEVLKIVSESREPFRLPQLRQRSEEAENEREAQFFEYSKFREQHGAALKEIRQRIDRDPDYRFHGKWGEIQARWEGFRARYEALDRKRQRILREIDREQQLAKMSLMSAEDVSRLSGEVLVKRLLVKVTTEGTADRFYVFVLRKYVLSPVAGGDKPPSRWIVAGIEESAPPKPEALLRKESGLAATSVACKPSLHAGSGAVATPLQASSLWTAAAEKRQQAIEAELAARSMASGFTPEGFLAPQAVSYHP